MDAQKLKAVLEKHALWLANKEGGERANLSRANLTGADLTEANLSRANLTKANLTEANLTGADLTKANLSGANLTEANLAGANLTEANLAGANLTEANLAGANLTEANLSRADLTRANLYGADLYEANLTEANLSGANLTGADLAETNLYEANLTEANLSGANLTGADLAETNLAETNLSGAKGLLDPATWLRQFEQDAEGIIVYKAIGNTDFAPASHWLAPAPNVVLTEVCNPLRTLDCACGVNFGTLNWVQTQYPAQRIWRCRIAWIDLAGVVVPYRTTGKARCARLTLLDTI